MDSRTAALVTAAALSLVFSPPRSAALLRGTKPVPVDVRDRVQLLLDDYFVAEKSGLTLEVAPARADHARLIAPDGAGDRYGVWPWSTVIEDGGRLRMWYSAYSDPAGEIGRMCYAESTDGVRWVKPNCGVPDNGGSANDNIVLTMGHPGSVFLDPSAPIESRFKCIFGHRDKGSEYGHRMTIHDGDKVFDWLGPTVEGAVSPDGLHWKKIGRLMDWYTDTGNVGFYDPNLRRYVCYLRDNQYPRFEGGAIRCVARTESGTFGAFPRPARVLAPDKSDPPGTDLYNPAAHVYPFADSVYLMFPSAFYHDTDNLEIQIATSRDGIRWARAERTPFVKPGPDGSFDSRQVYMGVGMVERGDEIWMYYGGFSVGHGEAKRGPGMGGVGRAVFLRDRLIAQVAGRAGGRLRTRPVRFSGRELRLNVDCGAGGHVRVDLLGADGTPIPGFSARDCEPLTGNSLHRTVRWKSGSDLSALTGKAVQLQFTLDGARLYAFQFARP